MVNLGTTSGTLSDLVLPAAAEAVCVVELHFYLRDVDFSPDGSFFVLDGTGYLPRSGDLGRHDL